MAECIEDARRAALDGDEGPVDPRQYESLRERLVEARAAFPPLYRAEFVDPYIATIDGLGENEFLQILLSDTDGSGTAGLMFDMAQAILQRGERYQTRACNAFQEVIGDLYDGFLSAADRRGVKPPDRGVTPPLVKWGDPAFGPYIWPADATANFGARAGVVSLPPVNARAGLFAWTALPHEGSGHGIIHADIGLEQELAEKVHAGVAGFDPNLADYWAARIDETASDVLGILNMGPAAAIGLIVYFRGLNKAFTGDAQLRSMGPSSDPHPADVLRGYLAAETVRLLSFGGAAGWADLISAETDKDASNIVLGRRGVSTAAARKSARLVAAAIAQSRLETLESHALIEIQNWRDSDEEKVAIARNILVTAGELPDDMMTGIYAAHVVAAAAVEALSNGRDIPVVFDRMLAILDAMHRKNPVWGPLFIRHPGDIRRDFTYVPVRQVPVPEHALPDIRDQQAAKAA